MQARNASAADGSTDHDPFAGGEIQRVVPATPPQIEIWLADRLDRAASLAYNESESFIFDGPLNIRALNSALQALVQRHDALRSTIAPDGQTLCVSGSAELPMEFQDLRGLSSRVREARVGEVTVAAVETPFSLEHGPLIRGVLLHLEDARHQLVLTTHHAVCDGWSWGILKRELATLYCAAVECFPLAEALPPAPSFADYAERSGVERMEAQALSDAVFWKFIHAVQAPGLELPMDRPRTPLRSFDAGYVVQTLDTQLLGQLRRASSRGGASLFAMLFAGFSVLVGRLADQNDVVIGVAAAGQSLDDNEGLVGHAVSMLPMRVTWEADESFAAVLQRAQTHVFDAMEHQRLTYGELLKDLAVARDPSRLPLVSVLFNVDQPIPEVQMRFRGLGTRTFTNPRRYENFELYVNAVEGPEGLALHAQFNAKLFDAATVQRWLASYEIMLRDLVRTLDTPIARIPLLSAADRQLLNAWNANETPYETGLRLGDLLQRGMARHAQTVAVRFEGRSVTYAELDALAWNLAHSLRDRGVQPGDLVGVCLQRSVELVAALVGVVYSGAAYVPLDPDYPAERLAQMCEDASMRVVLSRPAEAAIAGAAFMSDLQVVHIDPVGSLQPSRPGVLVGTSQDPAYVIFTSGSTGRPKGAMNSHAGIVNRLQWTQDEYPLKAGDRVMQKTPCSFDVSVWEFFWPLMCGATIVVARPDGHRDPSYIAQLIRDEGVTLLHFVPSMLRIFLDEPVSDCCSSVRQVLCSGEALPIDAVDRFFRMLPHARLSNLYGPTEAAVDVTYWNCVPNDPRRIVPIGRPIANTSMYVLDEALQPLPVGVSGELYIGGVQVGMGYVARADLTAERFIPDPHRSGGRMYKTGDVARWLSDGAIEYLGRADHQVKIRGNRVELGEIELALASHAAVARCIVVAREMEPADLRLVAYLVSAAEPAPVTELQVHLRSSLPEYMVPSHFVWLDAIPLLPNGKIDRKALPAPADESAEPARAVRLPSTATEKMLAELWRELLHVETIGADDKFLALGGHSLLVLRMASQIRSRLGLTLPVRQYFAATSLSDLAHRLDALAAPMPSAPAGRIRARDQQQSAPLSVMQERMWFMESLQPGRLAYHIESGVRLHGQLDEAAFDSALQRLLARHAALRTEFVESSTGLIKTNVVPKLELTLLPCDDLSNLHAGDRQATLMARLHELANRPFELRDQALVRVRLMRLDTDEYAFFLLVHHLIFDGWSSTVLFRDLAELYRAEVSATAARLPVLPVSYGDFATWHQEWIHGSTVRAEIEYWRNKLQGIREPLALPTDFVRPPEPGHGAGAVDLHVDAHHTEALRGFARSQDATLFMVLLAAYFVLLHRHTGQNDLVVGFPVRGRHDTELEDVIGYFANVLPLRLNVQPQHTFAEVLHNTRQVVLEALDHADAPFEQIVRELRLPRDSSRTPIYQTQFALQDRRELSAPWAGLQVSPLPETVDAVVEEIAVWIVERDDELTARMLFATDLFAVESITNMAQRYVQLLQHLPKSLGLPVVDLPMLLQREIRELEEWNGTDKALDTRTSLAVLLGRSMRRNGARPALVFGGQTLTSQDMATRANRLAHLLRSKGIGRGQLVGLCLERSPDMLAAQLAVLWAGAAYVPLDPAYPPDRLSYMAQDAGVALVLTDTTSRQRVDWKVGLSLCLTDEAAALARQPDTPLPDDNELAPRWNDPAYVIYTSGSTGKPKGVCVPHGAVVNFLDSMAQRPGMTTTDKIVAVTTISFDIAVLELLLPLSVGACIVMATRQQTLDGPGLRQLLENSGATMMQATPTAWRMLLAAGWNGTPQFKALTGGEALAPELAARLVERSAELWNMYGPTETTVWSTCSLIGEPTGGIDIGKPINNTQVYVLDGRQRQCPVGVPGEIHIAGSGLALGYLNRAELTAERFIADHISTRPGARMYRTGDLGRWRADGSLEHLGRLDYQVKVRGHRIELGEIESCLAEFPGVTACVVVVRQLSADDMRIIAYLVGTDSQASAPALREHLRGMLPDYMIPQHFQWIHEVPLLPNGKVDRDSLAAPSMRDVATAHTAPSALSLPEQAIADVWADILGVGDIHAADNFFDLGGHSLLAVQALAEMQRRIGRTFELRELIFDTLASIAAHNPKPAPQAPTVSSPRTLAGRWVSRLKQKIGVA